MYNKLFTLSDLFHNQELKKYLPQVRVNKNGGKAKVDYRYNIVDMDIYNYARMGAMPYMKNITMEYGGQFGANHLGVKGELRKHATIYDAYNGVLETLKSFSGCIGLIQSYGDTITDVMQKIYRSDRYKLDNAEPKLYLRINSLNEIKFMNKQQKEALLKNVVENIYFSDDFKQFREPSMERHSFIVNNRNVVRGYDSLKRDFDRKVRY